jgi:transcriptional regulator with XRE-family HTH domain
MTGPTRAWKAGEGRAARIRAVLRSRNLTLHQVSLQSARLYGPNSPARVPHTLYHSLTDSLAFGPTLAQICSLSRITSYCLEDWLSVLGIDLRKIASLQAMLPLRRTRLMDTAFASVDPPLFARIGCEDSFAYPELLPGSIVRLVPSRRNLEVSSLPERPPLLLIEHERGFWCGRFHVTSREIIHATSRELPYAQTALRCPDEARIVGTVDMEIRWIHRFENPRAPEEFAIWREPKQLTHSLENLGSLLRRARSKAGLTLREASELSQRASVYLGDERYSIGQSTLSEYEAGSTLPRHLEKAVAICLIYGLQFSEFVAASGTAADDLGQKPMPESLVLASRLPAASLPRVDAKANPGPVDFSMPSEIPWFLAFALPELSGIPHPSLRDFFRLTGDQPFLPAHTGGSVFALADRRKKSPARISGLRSWQQPAWILMLRSGEYLCACCSVDRGTLVLYPESDATRSCERLRLGRDAEVIGQVIAVARRIS